ncbi:hypothetical protein [Tenacibaculum caenipelagi]|uniref:Uncharacterized protein n=1 Tax=Tenacibaculum caenipelagi TaxID=1325435 RepID=A0A4R6TE78_9FLAO|nr:hypothetical protein [Tenacibaculum caenipelagi]TDQ27683.1 hypothetical protein DFQ07_1534 [Tenacibaculum caenipelagi]
MTEGNNIEYLLRQIEDKSDFMIKLSEKNGRKVNTMKNHWFSKASNYGVPDEELGSTIDFMQKYIQKQNGVPQEN